MAARDPLGCLKDCMQQARFSELSKRPNELCQQCETTLREAVAMARQRIWQALMPKWFKLQALLLHAGLYRCASL